MISQAVLKYIRADVLLEALLPKLKEIEDPEKLSALKLRVADWNRHTKKWGKRKRSNGDGPEELGVGVTRI